MASSEGPKEEPNRDSSESRSIEWHVRVRARAQLWRREGPMSTHCTHETTDDDGQPVSHRKQVAARVLHVADVGVGVPQCSQVLLEVFQAVTYFVALFLYLLALFCTY